jgi:hypothetical protein
VAEKRVAQVEARKLTSAPLAKAVAWVVERDTERLEA